MRENADRLFDRVLRARESGDSASVGQFAPMAILAYQNAGVLDADGQYHLSVLHTVSGDPAAGLAAARVILSASPDHLLGLSAAASAAVAQGDSLAARQFYQHFANVFANQRGKALPEYQDHAQLLAGLETEVKNYLAR
ncbi:MAG: hypothetical protein ACRENP_03775 [Longimicrobiales bacterium]